MYMRVLALFLVLLCAGSGCTTPALKRHTINQVLSVTDIRYQEIVDGLAIVANNPGTMPAVAMNTGGISKVGNTVGLQSSTTWDQAVLGFARQTLNLTGKHVPDQQWTVSPVAAQPNLEALQAAFMWPIYGPPEPGSVGDERLRAPRHGDKTGLHFDVERQLLALPPDWLEIGRYCDVPTNACYQAHCGETYVWVSADGMMGLSEFTLIVMDIATTDPQSLVYQQPTAVVVFRWKGLDITETRGAEQEKLPDDKSITVQPRPIGSPPPDITPGDVELQQPGPGPRLQNLSPQQYFR
jgi:hypothetical protein